MNHQFGGIGIAPSPFQEEQIRGLRLDNDMKEYAHGHRVQQDGRVLEYNAFKKQFFDTGMRLVQNHAIPQARSHSWVLYVFGGGLGALGGLYFNSKVNATKGGIQWVAPIFGLLIGSSFGHIVRTMFKENPSQNLNNLTPR